MAHLLESHVSIAHWNECTKKDKKSKLRTLVFTWERDSSVNTVQAKAVCNATVSSWLERALTLWRPKFLGQHDWGQLTWSSATSWLNCKPNVSSFMGGTRLTLAKLVHQEQWLSGFILFYFCMLHLYLSSDDLSCKHIYNLEFHRRGLLTWNGKQVNGVLARQASALQCGVLFVLYFVFTSTTYFHPTGFWGMPVSFQH